MATSSVARTVARFLSIALLLRLVADTSAQTVLPSNATIPPPTSGIGLELQLSDTHRMKRSQFKVVPLTREAGIDATATELKIWDIKGVLRLTDSSTANSITTADIAYINCDSNESMIGPVRIVQTAADKKPEAILLYSTVAQSCNVTGSFGYTTIYSTTTIADSDFLETSLQSLSVMSSPPLNARIVSNITGNPDPQGNGQNNNDGGPAPTTAVAMSILYSITGIITLLFLVIITTGALRAHRNPARYGPRRALGGRPRQSRAKGLARAMLETLPIVKFGDPEPAKPGSNRDIELEDGINSVHNPPEVVTTNASKEVKTEESPKPTTPAAAMASGMGPAQAESVKSGDEAKPKEEDLGCSICTEDFTAGEDVRVLPCQHKFHPACIDPWLLNVSGTCPLCRHDLNPTTTNTDEEAVGSSTNPDGTPLPPPLGESEAPHEDPAHAARRRVARFLDLHRLRTAPPDERIAALRRLREQSRAEGEPAEDAEEPSRRARVTNRLRDTFHIGTGRQPATTPQNDIPRTEAPNNDTLALQNETPREGTQV